MGRTNKIDAHSARRRHSGGSKLSFEVLTQAEDRLEELISLTRTAHEESRLSYITFDPRKVEAIVRRAVIDTKRHGIMMCYEDDRAVGVAYCTIGEYHIGAGTLVTTIHNINVLPEKRRGLSGGKVALGLIRGVETWSQARNAKEIFFHVTSGVHLGRTHKFVRRLGYQFVGGSYAKRI